MNTVCPLVARNLIQLIRNTPWKINLPVGLKEFKSHSMLKVQAKKKTFLYTHYVLNMLDQPSQQTYTFPYTETQCSWTTTLYCSPVLSIQMTSEMMNVVVISPQRCGSGRREINVKPPETHRATAHTQWPQHENPNDTSFIIQSSWVKTFKGAERKCTFFFLHPDLHGGHDVCSAVSPVPWLWKDPALNDCAVFLAWSLKVGDVFHSPLMPRYMISG